MSKLTVSIPDDLHQKIREELEKQGITTSQFIEQAVTNFFENPKGEINMATRTLAFQVSEELFQRVKAFLARYEEIYHRKLSQKEFVIGLIEAELDEADEEFEAAEAAAATENQEVEQTAEESADEYAFEITKALDGKTILLGNADYNADIGTADVGGTLIDTGEGVVSIIIGDRETDKTYVTDPTGIANNEDSYTMHAASDKLQNDRVLGSIVLDKVDLDVARYLAAGSNGDSTLEGAVYDLYASESIEHPDGVSGIIDYSKITDSNGQPIWHTTVLTNGGWDTDYLPILQKDRLVASAQIKDGKLAFANLYLGRYYLVERATGLVLPIDGNGKLYTTGKYPLLSKRLERTGQYADLAAKDGEYSDYIYKNQYLLMWKIDSYTVVRYMLLHHFCATEYGSRHKQICFC